MESHSNYLVDDSLASKLIVNLYCITFLVIPEYWKRSSFEVIPTNQKNVNIVNEYNGYKEWVIL